MATFQPAARAAAPHVSIFRLNRRAMLITGGAIALMVAVGIGSLLFSGTASHQQNNTTGTNYAAGPLVVNGVSPDQTAALSQADHLTVNGQLRVSNTLVLTPTATPAAPVSGQIYYDQNTNQPYFYNGNQFVSLEPTAVPTHVASIGGATGAIGVGNGLALLDGQIGLSANALASLGSAQAAGVTSFQGQTGAVSLSAGRGISLNGTTVMNTGVTNLTSTAAQIAISQDGNGNYTLSGNVIGGSGATGQIGLFTGGSTLSGSILSQSGSTVTVGGSLTVTGAISTVGVRTNSLQQTATGSNVAISAGNDNVVFTAGGRSFTFPTSGGASQTICTTGAICGAGAAPVNLQPGTPQADSGAGSSVAINNTGGGTLLQLQSNGVNAFVVNNNGSVATLAVAGSSTFNGAVSVAGNNSFSVGTGNTTLGGTFNVTGGASFSNTVSVTGNTTVGGTLSVTGATTFSGLSTGLVQATVSGQLSSGTVSRNDNTYLSGTLSAGNGGTGVNAATAANGQLLIGNGGGYTLTNLTQGTGIKVTNGIGSITVGVDNTVCTTAGNCAGVGGGVTTAGGTNGAIAMFTGAQAIGNSILSQSGTTITVAGTLSATSLQGNGSAITALNGNNISSGTIAVARGGTGANTFTSNGVLYGNGTGAILSTAAGATGECLVGNTGAAPSYQSCSSAASGGTPGGAAGGDLTGTYPNPTIAKLQGITVSTSALTSNQILQYNGTAWVNQTMSGDVSLSSAGVATIAANSITSAKIVDGTVTGIDIATNTLTNSNLTSGAYSNVTGTGALTTGSIASGFGTISTGNNIITTAAFQGGTLSIASGAFAVNATGAITAATGITSSGAITFSGLGAGLLQSSAGGVISSSAVDRNSGTYFTSALSVANGGTGAATAAAARTNLGAAASGANSDITSLSGLTTALSVGQGGTGATTAAAARTNLGAAASGANTDITSLSAATSIGSTSAALTLQGNASSVFTATAAGFTSSVGFANPTANVSYLFQSAAAGTYNICTTVGNCAGVGGGVTTTGGTTGKLAKFIGSQTLGDSLISESGSTVTVGGTLAVNAIAPTAALLLGVTGQNVTVQGATVAITSTSGANTNTLSFATPATASHTITVPNASGTVAVSATGPLSLDASGNLTCASCTVSGGGAGGAVDSLNAINGTVVLQGTTNQVVVTNNSGTKTITLSTPQDINTTSSVTFGAITSTGALSAGSLSTGGTLAVTGAATAASFNGLTLTANATGFTVAGGTAVRTVTVTSNVTLDQNLATTASPTFAALTLSTLNAAGIVHTNASGQLSISAVALGTDTTGNYVASLGALTGLTTTGNTGAGSTPTLAVAYGSAASTAAQGNTALSFTGSGNLTGTVSGTAGGGFTTNTLALINNPSFTGLVTANGGLSVGSTTVLGAVKLTDGTTDGFAGSLQLAGAITANQTYSLPTTGGTFCLSSGNCAVASGSSYYIQNQNAAQQASSNFWLSGTGRADTSFLAPSLDTAAAGTLSIGTTNATTLNIGSNAAAHTITLGSTTGASSLALQSGTGGFNLNVSGTQTFTTDASGHTIFKPVTNGSGIFKVQDSSGANLVQIDSGTNLITFSAPLQSNSYLYTSSFLTLANGATASYTTPGGSFVPTKINVTNYDPGAFGQVLALGIPSTTANASSRVVSIFDGRTTSHQPSIALFSPDENNTFGLNWNGSNATPSLASSTAGVNFSVNGGTTLFSLNLSGSNAIAQLGTASSSTGQLILANSGSGSLVTLQAGATSAAYTTVLPTAIGAANQCLIVGSVASTTQNLSYSNCLNSTNGVQLQATTPGTAQTGNFNITGTGIAATLNAGTSVLSPLLDTASAVALNIGTTNATSINLNQSTTLAAGKSLTFASGAGNFDQSASTGTFKTGSGTVSLNGATTVTGTSNSAFNVQTASNASVLKVDTQDGWVGVGNGSPTATLDVVGTGPAYTNGFESGVLSPFTTSGAGAPWVTATSAPTPYAGSYEAQAVPASYAASVLNLTETLTSAGMVSFYYSCNRVWDGVYFQIDNNTANPINSNCGGWAFTQPWTLASFGVASGTHTFKWIYNPANYTGGSSFTIDNVKITNVGATGTAALFNNGGVGIGLGNGVGVAHTLDVQGDAQIKSATNSTTAFQIQSATGTALLNADTTNLQVSVNQSNLVLNNFGTPGAPTASAGSNQGGSLSGAAGTTYYYKVSGVNAAGESVGSAETSIAGSSFTPLTAPGAPTLALAAGTNLGTGAYKYEVTFVTANGETTGGTEATITTTTGNQAVNLTAIPTGPTATTQRKIYRTLVGGATGSEKLLTTIADNTTTTYSDATADGSLGAVLPASNTATTNTNNATVTFPAITGASSYKIYRGTSTGGENVYQTATASPFTDTGAAGTAGTVKAADTTGRIGVGTSTPAYSIDAVGSINASIDLRVGGVAVCTATGCKVDSASGIQNQNAIQQASSNFWISGTGRSDTGVLSPALDTATGVALNIGATNATSIALGSSSSNITTTISGLAVVKPTVGNDTLTGFQVQKADSSVILNVDTINKRVGINTASPGYALDVNGSVRLGGQSSTGIFSILTAGSKPIFVVDSTNNQLNLQPVAVSTSGITTRNAMSVNFTGNYWNGSSAVNQSFTIAHLVATSGITSRLAFQNNAGTEITSFNDDGSVLFKNSTNSSTAFQVQNASGTALLTADTTNQLLTVKSGSTDAVLGAALIDTAGGTNDFPTGWGAPAGWTLAANSATHTSGTTALTSTWTPTSGTTYQVSYNYTGCSAANTLGVTFGGKTLETTTSCTGTNTVVITASSTAPLTFTPNTTYTGAVSNVSVKALTTQVNSVLAVANSASTTTLEIRGSGSNTNIFIGLNSGKNNTSAGLYNTAVGTYALQSNTIGYNNTANGYYALQANTTGFNNTATGYQSLQANTTGSNNTANGYYALQVNTTGFNNTATGYQSLQANTTGSYNTANGWDSLYNNTTGTFNVAMGYSSLSTNTTGFSNIAIGSLALTNNTTGSSNTATGYQSLRSNTTGIYNTANGWGSLYSNTTGSSNSALGYYAGYANTLGSNNTSLGYYAGAQDSGTHFNTSAILQNATAIGAFSQVQKNYTIALGSVDDATQVVVGATVPIGANRFGVSPLDYQTGTATRTNSSASLVGTGTTWTSAMVGDTIVFADGATNTVSAFTDATHITMGTVFGGTTDASPVYYRFHKTGFQVTNTGNAYLQNTSTTAFQVQNSSGTALLTADTTNQLLTVKSGSTDAVLGTALIDTAGGTNPFTTGWGAPAGWTLAANSATHTSGTTPLTSTWAPAIGTTYQITYNYTLCSVTNTLGITMGGVTLEAPTSCTGANTVVVTATSTAGLSFTPATGYTGVISNVVVKALTAQVNPVLAVANSSSTTTLEVRSSGSASNLFIGLNAGKNNTSSGLYNTALGTSALQNNTTGAYNTANGYGSLQGNTTGNYNTASGYNSLASNTLGGNNTAIGYLSLQANSTGNSNTAVGFYSLKMNTTGNYNTASGYNSLSSNTVGIYNTANGYGSLQNNTTANGNTASGYNSLSSNTTGNYNTANGYNALTANSTGGNNTATGNYSLYSNTTGVSNTANGNQALQNTTTGSSNSALGTGALQYNTTGNENSAIGDSALRYNTTGSNNSALGYSSGYVDLNGQIFTGASLQNATAIGAYAQVQASNTIVLGSVDNPTQIVVGATAPVGTNSFGVSPLDYQTGTATRTNASATLVGTGTIWTSAMVGDIIIFADGTTNTVAGFTDATHITLGTTYAGTTDASPVYYRFHKTGFQVTNNGNAYVQNTSTTAFQVQNSAGTSLLTADTTNQLLTVKSGSTDAVLGTALIDTAGGINPFTTGWNTSGWTVTANGATNNSGNTFVLSSTWAPTSGVTYQVSFTYTGCTSSNYITITLGLNSVETGGACTGTNTVVVKSASSSSPLRIIPTSGYTGTISNVVVKALTTQVNPVLAVANSASTTTLEIRGSGSYTNVFIGLNSGKNNTSSGLYNTAVGTYALQANTTGSNNTANGYQSLYANSTGNYNTASGYQSLLSNTTGSDNTANGYQSLQANTTGGFNTASGHQSLYANTTGNYNTASGYYALQSNTTGSYNTATGNQSLSLNTVGGGNVATGDETLRSNTTGGNNTASGYQSMMNNTTGGGNSGYGSASLALNTTGSNNTAAGSFGLRNNTTGNSNVATGYSSLYGNTTGSYNTALGYQSLQSNTTGSYNAALGYNAGYQDSGNNFATTATLQNATAIGAYAQVQKNNTIVLGSVDTATQVVVGATVPLNTNAFGVSPLDYQAGTATRTNASATLTGTGTTWTAAMVGDTIVFADGTTNTVTGFTDATHVTMGTTFGGTTDASPVYYRFHKIGLQVATAGTVGIGVATPGYKLDVAGDINTSTAFRVAGTSGMTTTCNSTQALNGITIVGGIITAGSCSTNSADLAENYGSSQALEPGEVVANDTTQSPYVVRTSGAYQDNVVGVVSTSPAHVLGDATPGYPIALAGRVPVKVSLENGPIKPGDHLVASSTPGYAMKATGAGMSIGLALTGYDGSQAEAKVEVFVGRSYYNPNDANHLQAQDVSASNIQITGNTSFASLNVSGMSTVTDLTVTGSATISGNLTVTGATSVADITVNGHIIGRGNAPALVVGAAAGTSLAGQVAPAATVDGTDTAGTITVTSGATPANAGVLAELTFAKGFPAGTNVKVALTPTSSSALDIRVYVEKTATGFRIVSRDKLTAAVQYSFDYIAIGSQQQ